MKRWQVYFIIFALILIISSALSLYSFTNQEKTYTHEEKLKNEAIKLYNQSKEEGMNFSSQCLGKIQIDDIKYIVDLTHDPRTSEDNLPENQCPDFLSGKIMHFVELDKDGNILRIA